MNRSVALIANHLQVEIELPCKITEKVIIRRPDEKELTTIRELLHQSSAGAAPFWIPYEAVISKEENGGLKASHTDDSTQWKYWVLCDEDGISTHKFESTARLIAPSIEIALRLQYCKQKNGEEIFGYSALPPHILERYRLHHKSIQLPVVFNESTVEQLRQLDDQKQALGEESVFIKEALAIFDDLHRVTDSSNLKTIGYFSVIEALVTHAPRLSETLDSISHQIRGKLILLSKRFVSPVNTNQIFGDIRPEKLWSKLYAYRSAIAHGRRPSFEGELSVLKNTETLASFLELICKQLLILSFKEPELVRDLREC